jgi:asparagine synthase (glutamine-hydrolysing)
MPAHAALADTDFILLGEPRFDQGGLSTPAGRASTPAAWQALLSQGPQQALARVRGEFAMGLREAGGRTWLVADRFATHSLCYRVVDGRLWFAARADELANAGGRPAEIDPQAIYDYLYFHVIPAPRTIYKDVFRLPAAHHALFEHGALTVEPYWQGRFTPERSPSFDALKAEFRSLLEQAVKRRLDGGLAACFLSGGTDSSTVAGLIGRVTGEPAHSYSIGFDAQGYDEMAYARIAAQHFGTHHHEYYVTPDDLVASIPKVARFHDQPFGNSSAVPAYHCALMAQADGATRMLAGDGGDELFGGNSRYAKQRIFDAYGMLPATMRRGLVEPLLMRTALGRLPGLRKGRSYVEQASVPMPDRLEIYNLLLRLGVQEVLTPAFLEQVDQRAPLALQRSVWHAADTSSDINRVLAFDWRFTLADNDLRKVAGSTGLAGLDVAFPLLDDDLLDFSLKLPPDYKLRGLKLRWFFKEALRDFLPEAIITKQKHGFGLPFGVWLLKHEGLQRLARSSLDSLAGRGILRADFLDKLLGSYLPAHPGYYGEMVWIAIVLEQWLQAHAADYSVR